jgi:hypothetical protein
MNRTILCSAIEGLVSKCGYEFQLNDKSHYPTTVCRYPAAFAYPPEFVRMEGRKHGRITYKLSLILAQQGAKLSPVEQNDKIAEMEQQMVDIFVELSNVGSVAVVEGLTISPTSPTIDNHGAISIVGEAEVVTIF